MKPLSVEEEKAGKVPQGLKVSSPLLKYFEVRDSWRSHISLKNSGVG